MASLIRVAEGPRAAGNRPHFRTQQPHAKDVGLLPANVFLAHVNDAFQPEPGTGGGRGHAMLSGAGLGDHAVFAHPHGQQGLAQRVVDLVGTGVIQILPFQVDLGAAGIAGSDVGVIERRRPADIMLPQVGQLGLKRGVAASLVVCDRNSSSAWVSVRARSGRRNRQNGLWRRGPGCWLWRVARDTPGWR